MPDFNPASSKKFRALQQVLGPLDEVAREYAVKPDTYGQIADEWTARVKVAYPGIGVQFRTVDVCRLFQAYQVGRYQRAEAAL